MQDYIQQLNPEMNRLLYTTNGGKKNLPRVECIKCGRIGNLTIKKTKSHGTTYEYYYVQHYIKESDKIEWCYLGSYESLPQDYRETLQRDKAIHNNTQNCTQTENTRIESLSKNRMVRGVGFEPTNLCRIAASGLRLRPGLATPAR